jgi:competence protein ComEA
VAPLLVATGGVAGLFYWRANTVSAPPPIATTVEIPTAPGILVHVSGAVVHPGLYHLKRGDRVYAAIAAAGGFAAGADLTRLPDLAGRMRDGQQVKVAFQKGAGGGVSSGKIDINTATVEELASVPGISVDFAAAVVQHRARYGPLPSVRDLVTVLGMPADAFAAARKYLTA